MLRWLPLIIIVALVFYLVSWMRGRYLYGPSKPKEVPKPRLKGDSRESWSQLYQTDSKEEAQQLKAHMEELDVQCIYFEQGKKGVDGNPLPSFGFVVPKSQLRQAQNFLFRFLERKK